MADNKLVYKGYDISLSVQNMDFSEDVIFLVITKDGHRLTLSSDPRGDTGKNRFTYKSYTNLIENAKTIIDFIEVMTQERAMKLFNTLDSTLRFTRTSEKTTPIVDTPDFENKSENTSDETLDTPRTNDSLNMTSEMVRSWFEGTDTSRFLK